VSAGKREGRADGGQPYHTRVYAISCRWERKCSFLRLLTAAYGGRGKGIRSRIDRDFGTPCSPPSLPAIALHFTVAPLDGPRGGGTSPGSGQRLPADRGQPQPVVSCRLVLPGCVGTLHQRAERCSAAHCSASHGGEARPTQRSRSTPERRETGSAELHYRGDVVHTPLPFLGCTHAGTPGRCTNPPTCNGKDAPPTVLLSCLDPVRTLVGEDETHAHPHTRHSMNTLVGRK